MEQLLQNLLEVTNIPLLSAFILGLLTAISPCPLAMNITAIGFISKDIENKKKIFYNGLLYTLGRTISYTTLGILLYLGASTFHIARIFNLYGEKLMGPLLIIIGVFMFDFIKINIPSQFNFTDKLSKKVKFGSSVNALLLGIIFALAFCPYSGVLFFGMLIPMTISSTSGLILPVSFAIATGLPVIIIAWLLAFSISSIGGFYNKLKVFEIWFRRVTASAFILVGFYLMYIYFIK